MSAYTAHEIFADEATDYLDRHNIYELFGSMMKDLVINKPKDPLSHMISLLERPAELLRIVVLGAPGSLYEPQAARLLSEFNLVHIRVEQLLETEIANKTSLGAKVRSWNEQNKDVPDELINSILRNRLKKNDALTKGWVLEGYPTTPTQLQSMQLSGILANKVFVMHADEGNCRKRAIKSGIYQDLSSAQFDTLFIDYARNLKQIVPMFPKQIVRFVDADASEDAMWNDIKSFSKQAPLSKAPRRPMRVCVIGPTGAGKATQCTKLSHRFGVVHLSSGDLLRKELAKSRELDAKLAPFMAAGALVPDEDVSPIVIRRLLQNDCRARGYVLDGFPRTVKQANDLAAAHLAPNRVIHLDVSTAVSHERCLPRRVDPDTGDVYYNQKDAAADVAGRLVTQTKDENAVLKTLLLTYSANVPDVLDYYAPLLKTIDGTQPEEDVFEQMQHFYLSSIGARKFGRS